MIIIIRKSKRSKNEIRYFFWRKEKNKNTYKESVQNGNNILLCNLARQRSDV